MSSGGLSTARLERMHDIMYGYVARGECQGSSRSSAVAAKCRLTRLVRRLGGSDPIRRATIFRVTSMTKPITAAAAMILVEECKLRLDEPVGRLLPELADRKVLRHLDGPLDATVPANRPITVRDLHFLSSDPAEEMVAILMTQRAGLPMFSGVYLDFWTSVYQAIDD